MKTFISVLLLAVLVTAEPPQYRQARRFRVAREEAEGSGDEKESKSGGEAPYPAAGYKPSQEFNLPSRTELAPPSTSYGTPDNSYSAPFNTYLTPQTEYGLPSSRSNEGEAKEPESSEEGISSEEGENKKEGEKEEKPEKEKGGKKTEEFGNDVINAKGAYYVLLPGAQLQRVQFQTENDLNRMAYTARLQYRDEDRAPIYYYTSVPQYQAPAAAYSYYKAW